MKRRLLILCGIFLCIAGISALVMHSQRERWEAATAVGKVVTVGARRIELRTLEGKVLFAEITPETRAFDGPNQVPIETITPNTTVMIAGLFYSPERMHADVVRVIKADEARWGSTAP